MKKQLLSLVVSLFSILAFSQTVNIPDADFKAFLLSSYIMDLDENLIKIDANNDGEIQTSEAENVIDLDIWGKNFNSIEGIRSFKNLKKLDCYGNKLTILDLSGLTSLDYLYCGSNKLTSLDVSTLTSLTTLNCSNNNLTSLNVSGLTSLKTLNCHINSLTSLDVSDLSNLENLWCYANPLTSLDLSGLTFLRDLSIGHSSFTSLDLSDKENLETLFLNDIPITSLDFSNTPKLWYLGIIGNSSITSLDFSNSPQLIRLNITSNTSVTYLNLKNGSKLLTYELYESNLKYICCDEEELEEVAAEIEHYGVNAAIDTYCSFYPGGEKNNISGKVTYDSDNNGCDINDEYINNFKIKLDDGTESGFSIVNDQGTYNFYTKEGDFTLTPIFENPYYTITPPSKSFTFTDLGNTEIQDFCISPIANKNDLEVKIIPIIGAIPGFDTQYKLIYKNKGTTILSGNVDFYFNDALSNYTTATQTPSSIQTGKLSWDFTHLKPFERKEVIITLKINTPTDATNPVNSGDVLSYSAFVYPLTSDETPTDNIATLKQTVVNSLDPNDKTCLQGSSITPELVGEYVDYLIRFENNGTGNAVNIVVKDMIDTNVFDIESLLPIDSSHPYELNISNGNKVEFIFEGIQLPFDDANNDGYIAFKIKIKPNVTVGTELKNKADIYFDFNFPIITNEYVTTVELVTLSSESLKLDVESMAIYPNPATDMVNFNKKIEKVEIYDINGRLIQASIIEGTKMDVSHLKTGNYLIKLTSKNGSSTEKLIKK